MVRIWVLAIAGTLLAANAWPDGSILDTKHNLSISGPGSLKASQEGRACLFCHTPHNTRSDIPYLWNRSDQTVNYVPYQSSTLHSTVGQPSGASKLCLSCHDGTIALGATLSEPQEISFEGGLRFIPEGQPSRLGTDLSDDHPISFPYDSNLVQQRPEFADPATLQHGVRLDGDGQLQCTTCHDPHDDTNGKFLVVSNVGSNLCTTCHQGGNWTTSSHALSSARWDGQGADPWPHTEYQTVSENGCGNCHRTHTAGGAERLLNYFIEEDNCLVCHSGNVAAKDIAHELTKQYHHGVQDYAGVHDAAENFETDSVSKHVECADCHDPHSANSDPSPGQGRVSGFTTGVTGI
ncbi:cytochrome c3 family protein, partial [Planctomycetota bacterium]